MRQTASGFTLVEVLVVVAVIGILAAIAIPQFTKYRVYAAVSHAETDLGNCMTEATGQEIVNGIQALNCTDLPGNLLTCTVTIHIANGTSSLTTPCPVVYSGYALLCAITNNTGACQN